MLQVVDYSWARPSPQLIRDTGYVGALRYLSHDPSKNLSPVERDALFAAGLGVGLIWETTARRPSGGFAAGAEDVHHAEAQADRLGWPGDRPLYYAVDFDTGPDGAVTEYFHGINSGARRPTGCYGSYRVIEGIVGGGIAAWGWQCAAWSGDGWGTGGSIGGRRVSIHARLFQHPVPIMGGACDANDVLAGDLDWGGWLPQVDPDELRIVRQAIEAATQHELREGDKGDAVFWAQVLLNQKLGPTLATDGIFGPATAAATRRFQLNLQRWFRDARLAVDGVIGPQTWYFLLT